jgi:predicted nucleic acid-binding protein
MIVLALIALITLTAVVAMRLLVRWDNKRAWKRRQHLVVQQLKREWIEADRESAVKAMRYATRRNNDGGRVA